jgi:hypothetical protein
LFPLSQVNGLSNLFWGWGREDDEFYQRMKEAGMTVSPESSQFSVSCIIIHVVVYTIVVCLLCIPKFS